MSMLRLAVLAGRRKRSLVAHTSAVRERLALVRVKEQTFGSCLLCQAGAHCLAVCYVAVS
jgi:hypothetical protein